MSEDAHAIAVNHNLRDLAATGFHFCKGCQRISTVDSEQQFMKCDNCHSHRIKWCPPIPGCHGLPKPPAPEVHV